MHLFPRFRAWFKYSAEAIQEILSLLFRQILNGAHDARVIFQARCHALLFQHPVQFPAEGSGILEAYLLQSFILDRIVLFKPVEPSHGG